MARRHGGAPLDAKLRRSFEPRFNADFSGVRVHAGPSDDTMPTSSTCKGIEPIQGTIVDSGVGPKIQNCDDLNLASHGVTPSAISEQIRRAQVAIRAAIAAVDTVWDSSSARWLTESD